jgi:hypothetical protein
MELLDNAQHSTPQQTILQKKCELAVMCVKLTVKFNSSNCHIGACHVMHASAAHALTML